MKRLFSCPAPYLIIAIVAGIALTFSLPAQASRRYPDIIANYTGTFPPDCAICHSGNITAQFAVTTPFGASLRSRGLAAGNDMQLEDLLAALDNEGVDSDRDGIGDIDELRSGTDPNVPNTGKVPPLQYGCLSVAKTGGFSDPFMALLFAGLFIFVARGRHRR